MICFRPPCQTRIRATTFFLWGILQVWMSRKRQEDIRFTKTSNKVTPIATISISADMHTIIKICISDSRIWHGCWLCSWLLICLKSQWTEPWIQLQRGEMETLMWRHNYGKKTVQSKTFCFWWTESGVFVLWYNSGLSITNRAAY